MRTVFLLLAFSACRCGLDEAPPVVLPVAAPSPEVRAPSIPPPQRTELPELPEPPEPAPQAAPVVLEPPPVATGPFVVGTLREEQEVEGCSCHYTRRGSERLVFTTPIGNVNPEPAFIHLDGRVVQLYAASTFEERSQRNASDDDIFVNRSLRVRLRTKTTHDGFDQDGESWSHAGTMEITAPGRPRLVLKIEGGCGC